MHLVIYISRCRVLVNQHPANRTHNPQLHTTPATWKNTAQNTTRSNHCIILLSSWWWAWWCPKHVEQAIRSAIKTSVASSWHFISTYFLYRCARLELKILSRKRDPLLIFKCHSFSRTNIYQNYKDSSVFQPGSYRNSVRRNKREPSDLAFYTYSLTCVYGGTQIRTIDGQLVSPHYGRGVWSSVVVKALSY